MPNPTFYILAIMAAGIASPTLASEFVKNGNFESFSGNTRKSFEFGYSGSPTVTYWTSALTGTVGKNGYQQSYNILFNADTATTIGAQTRHFGNGEKLWAAPASPAGNHFVALDGDVNFRGLLSQNIDGLTVGNSYRLTFDWAAAELATRTSPVNLTEFLTYTVNGVAQNTNTLQFKPRTATAWNKVSYTFVAGNTNTVLSFLSKGTPSGQPPFALLDNVSISAVPEPATWAVMVLGFGMVGGAMRSRRRKLQPAAA